MSFEVAAESYDAFMGRYSRHLSRQLADLAGVAAGQTVLDVGCGPGALTVELAERVGAEAVTAIDPSEAFVLAVRRRVPGATVERASAEELPLPDDRFDAALTQLRMFPPSADARQNRVSQSLLISGRVASADSLSSCPANF